jgi:phosphate transport system protein
MMPADNGKPEVSELRRTYHDRIAALRERSIDIVSFPVSAVQDATAALLAGDTSSVVGLRQRTRQLRSEVEAIDSEVVALLALESPVARDLRMVLASRDVAQTGLLCAGLCVALAGRAGGAGRVLVPSLTELVGQVAHATIGLLDIAQRAWAILDPPLAIGLLEPLAEARLVQTQLIAALLDLDGVPMETALDLAMATRAFDRLADHAEEISRKVCFATGTPWPAGPD